MVQTGPLSGHSGHGRTRCWPAPVAIDLGCVKTCEREERAELFSLVSSPDGDRQRCRFSNWRNRDEISIRKLNVGVFTRPRPISAMRGSDLLRRKLTFEPCISGRKFLI